MLRLGKSGRCSIPTRPVRAVAITFAILAALFVITTPFMPDVERLTFFFGGLAYSASLAIFVVGISLRGRSGMKQVMISMLICFLVFLSVYLPLVYGMLTQDYTASLAVFGVVSRIGLWLIVGLLVVLIIIAALGWKNHFQNRPASGESLVDTCAPAAPKTAQHADRFNGTPG